LLDDVALTAPQNQRIVIKDGSKIKIIPIQDIFYLEAADDFVKVFTKEGYFLKNKTMGHFEQVLDPSQFVRSHRSYIVNLQQITRIDPYEKDSHLVILSTGAKLSASKSGYSKLKEVLGI